MKANSDIPTTTEYATEATYIETPSNAQWLAGVEPQRTLPAAWWNYFTNLFTNTNVQAKSDINNILTELTNVLTAAGITPNPAENAQLLSALNSFNADLIIDSDAKLLQWQTSGTYPRVFIRAGTWTLPTGGIDLTARGTKEVRGEVDSLLIFSNTTQGLYYTSLPSGPEYRMQGINVRSINTVGNGSSAGFQLCSNLSYCTGEGQGIGLYSYGRGFYQCDNLIACRGIGSHVGSDAFAIGFSACANLVNCVGYADVTAATGSRSPIPFQSCVGVTLCRGSFVPALSSYIFSSCRKMQQNEGTYSNSHASATANASYVCADTPEGGFNS